MRLESKGLNLLNLKRRGLRSAKIAPLVITNFIEFMESKEAILDSIARLGAKRLIIRSSSSSEDLNEKSNAGAFLSIANVDSNDTNAICDAIKKVADSMPSPMDCILIQEMLENIALCGVAFSVDKDNLSPYFCVQYDTSGSHDSITSGASNDYFSYFEYRNLHELQNLDSIESNDINEMRQVISLIKELESIYNNSFLDIEFAFVESMESNLNIHDIHGGGGGVNNLDSKESNKTLYLLQVRSIVTKNKQNLFDKLPSDALFRLYKRFNSLQTKRPHILGDRAIFGVMPDWNPAEIIGLRPKRLAFSLYKEIITDSIWAYQRDNYGYKDLRSHPLMHSFLGIPYIDVRLSFNSFIPKKLDSKIAEKLVNYYINTLSKNPKLHDKVEFEIVFSCYDLNASAKLKSLKNHGFNDNEIKRLEFSLLELTNSILNEQNGLYKKDMDRISKLDSKFLSLKDSNLSPYDKIYWLLEECKRYGTLPFAGVARAGFVAMQLLNSLVEIGFLSVDEKAAFLNSLHTISKNLSHKISHLDSKNKAAFLREYGHLRAGSYNILSPRYDEGFDCYFELDSMSHKSEIIESKKAFRLDSKRSERLDNLLRENGLLISSKGLFSFFKKAIEGREYAKFKFSKLLSYAIVVIGELGAHYDISKEDMAHLDIQDIRILYSNLFSQSPKVRFLSQIAANKKEYELTNAVKLPELLCDSTQIFYFFSVNNEANFITQKSVIALVALESSSDISGKIVLIKSADPGYDYIFTKNIAGFITCYGGANSHMAIRASELALPAVIGVGEENFARYAKAKKLQINATEKQVIIL